MDRSDLKRIGDYAWRIEPVGRMRVPAIIFADEARDQGGDFKDLFDFASRVDSRRLNKGVLEALVQCGAFDSMLAPMGIDVSRLASGLPVGGDLEYADEVTLGRAFEGRRKVS